MSPHQTSACSTSETAAASAARRQEAARRGAARAAGGCGVPSLSQAAQGAGAFELIKRAWCTLLGFRLIARVAGAGGMKNCRSRRGTLSHSVRSSCTFVCMMGQAPVCVWRGRLSWLSPWLPRLGMHHVKLILRRELSCQLCLARFTTHGAWTAAVSGPARWHAEGGSSSSGARAHARHSLRSAASPAHKQRLLDLQPSLQQRQPGSQRRCALGRAAEKAPWPARPQRPGARTIGL